MPKRYDILVVGAGIAGCAAAWILKRQGFEVLLVDRAHTPATGGSGAAGAFVSPKIGKGGPLQALTNEAFAFATHFYRTYFSDYFYPTGVVRIPKDAEDARKFPLYEPHNDAHYRTLSSQELASMGIDAPYASFYFDEAGVCDAPKLCSAMSRAVAFMSFDVRRLEATGEGWNVYDGSSRVLYARRVVLATGYENGLLDMRYMGVRGTWGSRGDYASALPLEVSMHKKISISANIGGIVKLGATHVKAEAPCMVCDGAPLRTLEEQAATMVDTRDFRLKQTYCGMRAGSKDYFPLLGRIVDVGWMLTRYPNITRGQKAPLRYLPDIYVLNGLGGRGFVFAPLMAKQLAEHLCHDTPIDARIDPDRLFWRWVRRLKLTEDADVVQ